MGAQTGVIELSLAGDVDQLSAIACPIAQTPQTLDILYATFPGPYGTGEWLALVELAVRQLQQAEQAWQARQRAEDQAALERELERARRIQMQLVPRAERLRDFGELEIAYSFEPCHWVGGDYLDALQGPGGEAVLAVADVCGKGLQAALITACIHSMVYAQTQAGVSPEQMTQALNDYLVHTLPSESFVTMVVLWWDPTTKRLKQMNAGHPPVFVANAQGELRRLSWGENLPLGMTPMAYQITDETLEPGEVMGIYTDGLSELAKAGNGPMLGTEGVGKLLGRICQNASGQPLTHLQEEFRSLLDDYQGNAPPGDDRTFLLARRR
jgi:serine phosphatase RsbU (regulator of sigma subunit)